MLCAVMRQYVAVRSDGQGGLAVAKQVIISASEGHRTFGKLLRRVYGSDEHLVVERDGFRVAVLLSYQEYRALRQERDLAGLAQLNRELSREAERQQLSEEDFLQELQRTRQETVAERYGDVASA